MAHYKIKYCIICGKELTRYQQKYCGAVCAAAANAIRQSEWAKALNIGQLRHWYRN